MSEFLDRISKLSPQRLALLADELNERIQASERSRKIPLAIVGIGCRLPGGVRDSDGFWKLLSEGVDAIGEVPSSRWNIEEFYDRNPDTPGKMATRWGGFIEGHDQFDPKFFGIAPTEAICMDPQQRLLLETAWEALENAGIAPSDLTGTLTGVFAGICNADYSHIALNAPRSKITPYFASGLSHAVAAGRISYVLGLQGPSLAVDTSCSASLVAVHLACQSLRLGECNAALAGGVNLIFDPDITIALSQSRMMAPDGRCKAFSESADGFVRGEGSGMIVLKRLPDALRDHNRILAVIRGTACNQDGRSNGLTAPNGPSQEAVVAAALSDAGLRPQDVDYIEAHGTGTALGDPIEANALNAVFAGRSSTSDPLIAHPLLVGSVKTNLGHLEAAAGIAGLIKLVLAIQHGQIPASLHFQTPNHRIEWDRLPMKVPARLESWDRRGEKRRIGGVSSFGFSGTNAHVIVEEYVEGNQHDTQPILSHVRQANQDTDGPLLFPLSAKTESALKVMAARLHHDLMEHPTIQLADVAHTLTGGRSHFECRAAVIAASRPELLELLASFGKNDRSPAIQAGNTTAHSPRVAWVFPAEFSEENMGRTLYETAPVFRESIQRCEEVLRDDQEFPGTYLDQPLTSLFYPEIDRERSRGKLHVASKETVARPARYKAFAIFAIQYALAELWKSCGIEPSAVLGYGVGEYVAACVAGVFSLQDSLRLVGALGQESSVEFEGCARRVTYHLPKIAVIPSSIGPASESVEVNSAAYWLRRSRSTVAYGATLSTLAKEGCAANVYFGDSSALQEFANKSGTNLPGKWLVSLSKVPNDFRQFLHTAASLYVLGCELDRRGFYQDPPAKTVSLPTYPFERERYWLDIESNEDRSRERFGTVSDEKSLNEETAENNEWFYDLVWEAKPLPRPISQQSTAGFDEELIGQMAVTPASEELLRVARLLAAMMPVYATYILQALQEAGLSPLPTSAFSLEDLSQRLKIAPTRRRVLGRLLAILVEDKIVERVGDRFQFVNFRPRPDADGELQKLGAEYPECLTEVNILRRCGKKLSAVLRGSYDPMQLVFADGSIGEVEQIYGNSPITRFFNDKAAKVVRSAADRIMGRPTRILEIGGGTGATTVPVLSELAGKNVEYTFTDISAVFLSRARVKFSKTPFMSYRVLNIENDPVSQGFEAGGYDVIVAANVLHATADLRRTIAHVRKLLVPGGLLLLVEGVRPDRWLDLTLGLTDGWWRFVDLDLRPEHPLISAESWARVLSEAGMSSTRTISYITDGGSASQQIAIVSRVDPDDALAKAPLRKLSREWILLADEFGVGDALHKLLAATGEACEIIRRPDSASEIASVFRSLQTRSKDGPLEIVYLWGMDVAELISSKDALSKGTELCSKTLVHLIQVLLARGKNAANLWIATRGSQATGSFSPSVGGAVQSLSWGVGRVLGLEVPEQYRALIDLDRALPPEAAAADLFTELSTGDGEDQIAYRDGQRLVARLRHSSLNYSTASASKSAGLRGDGSYLIVGGLGGIGLRLSQWAAEQRPGHLILLGRTGTGSNGGPFAAERLRAIEKIHELGIKVTVVEGDVASEADMARLFQRFGEEFPLLRGVFHTATVVGAAELGDLTDEQIEAMLRPKVLGTWILHGLTRTMPLDFFLVFSSAASLMGAKSMAHYAAANQFLDSLAHSRRAVGLPMLSVNWGAWDVMRLASRSQQSRFSQAGLLPMDSAKLFQFIGKLTHSRQAQVMIANVDWDVLKPALESQRSRPLLENLSSAQQKPRSAGHVSTPPLVIPSSTIEMSQEERRKFMEAFVLEQAARVLGFRHGELPSADVPLTDIGLDSLMAVDLRNRLQTMLGQELPSTIVFDYPTISGLVGMLETMLWAAHGSTQEDLLASEKDEIRI